MRANPSWLTGQVVNSGTVRQRRLRTSNALERVNQELKRRTRVAVIFPNEAAYVN